jgi:type I restriction enzyme R subunit
MPIAARPHVPARWRFDVRRSYEQAIDETSSDRVIDASYSRDAADRARSTVESWEQFVADNKDEITALQILYSRPRAQRLRFREVKELAQTIARPPYQWTPEKLWEAYEQLDRSKVRGSGQRVITDLVSLVRVALEQDDRLVPYPELVDGRFRAWLLQQENAGRTFTSEQLTWLERIRDHVAASLSITTDDFGYTPFAEAAGLARATQVFGDDLGSLLNEISDVLAA